MANTVFTPAREGFLSGEIDWDTATIKVAAVSGYTPAASHKFVSDVTGAGGGTIRGTSAALTAKTVTGGTADAADLAIPALATSSANHGLLVFQSSAVTGGADVAAAAQRVIYWFDTGTGLPFTTNGGDANVAWAAGGIVTI